MFDNPNPHRPILIGLNGPPRCGKTFIMDKLQRMLPRAHKVSIQDGLFDAIRQDIPKTRKFATYADYKDSDEYNRAEVIKVATDWRIKYGDGVFTRMSASTDAFMTAKVVIFDNIGLPGDHIWARRVGDPYLLLRIDSVYDVPEPTKAWTRRLDTTWQGDSRMPFYNELMLTAYDSSQMSLLLDWLDSPEIDKTGTPYHEYATLWKRITSA